MPAFEVENRTPAPGGFQVAGDFGRLRRVFEARAGEGAGIRRGRASEAPLKAQLWRALAKWIVRDSAARHVGTGLGRSCSISRRISVNSALGTATSASWKVTYRPWRTTLAPILTSLLRNVVSDHCFTSCGNAKVRMKLARL